jgi:hypothetical protein
MSQKVCIQYELGQHGWSSFRLNIGAASVVVGPFGYCTDALGDLVRAALMIATSGSRAEISFDAEPMEWRLIAGTQSSWTDFHVRVLTFPYALECSAESFVRAVLGAAQAVWDEYGSDGYDKAWGGPCGFPLRALHALKAAISVQEPRTS